METNWRREEEPKICACPGDRGKRAAFKESCSCQLFTLEGFSFSEVIFPGTVAWMDSPFSTALRQSKAWCWQSWSSAAPWGSAVQGTATLFKIRNNQTFLEETAPWYSKFKPSWRHVFSGYLTGYLDILKASCGPAVVCRSQELRPCEFEHTLRCASRGTAETVAPHT